ncbi:MAG: tetratricopeptide repeat protein [Candidatus Latescibacterota bacterium]|jgi:tetratricopeptide (TPR) repeat protein
MRHIYALETEPALDAYDLSIHEECSLITFTFAEEAVARGDTTDARRFYEESLVAAKRIADSIQAPLLYRNLSMIYHRLGAYREAIVYYSKSFGAEENPTPTMIGIGNSYVQEGKEELGIFAYQIAFGTRRRYDG